MQSEKDRAKVPYFSTSRFGPSTVAILVLFAIASFISFRLGALLLTGALVACDALIFGIKSFEVLTYGRPEVRKFTGKKCTVIVEVDEGKRGIVRLIRDNGKLDPELWSAEANTRIVVGEEAIVTGIENIILHVEPILHVKEK